MKSFKWTLLILWMVIIFLFSNQTGKQSTQTSNLISGSVETVFSEVFSKEGSAKWMVRKGAHMLEFLILGILSVLAFRTTKHTPLFWICLLFCLFYACTDEFHQLWVIGRSARIQDVCIDTIGSYFGILIGTKMKKRD